jgi:hypothetical protein
MVRNVGSYHAIETSGAFKITLTTDGPETVTLTSDQPQLLNSVTTIVKRGILKLKMGNSSTNVVSFSSPVIIINNNVNTLNYSSNNTIGTVAVHIGGAHHLKSLIISGSSNVESRNTLIVDRFQLNLSGCSSFDGSFKVQQLDVEISGCSNVSFNGSSDRIMLASSGSSSCHTTGLETKTAQVTLTGCSNVSLKGSAETISLSLSGSSSCEALYFETKTARVTTSGSSHASIYCTQTLEADASGSSDIRYKGKAKVLKGSPTKID